MEDYTVIDSPSDSSDLVIDTTISDALLTSANWAIFLAVLGFLSVAVSLVAGVSVVYAFTRVENPVNFPFSAWGFSLIYFVFGFACFFPALFMVRFASKTRDAIRSGSQVMIRAAFLSLRDYYKYTGILVIGLIVFYVIAMIVFVNTVPGFGRMR